MNTLIGWPGGKKNLVKTLLRVVPPHRIYVEPFAGSGRLFFSKEPCEIEVLNDLHSELINFYRVVRFRPAELTALLEKTIGHPAEFQRMLKAEKHPCELERAAQFWYTAHFSFGQKGENYAWPSVTCGAHVLISRVRATFRAAAKRLDKVGIDCRDFAEMFTRYDAPDAFFYCDPPYENFRGVGQYECKGLDVFERLLVLARSMKGKVLISYSYSEAALAAASEHFCVRKVRTIYSISSHGNRKKVTELLIANYDLPKRL